MKEKQLKKRLKQAIKKELSIWKEEIEELTRELIGENFLPHVRDYIHQAVREAIVKGIETEIEETEKIVDPLRSKEEINRKEITDGEIPQSAPTEQMTEGLYLYCIANSGERFDFGNIGIEKNRVYSIPNQDICAIVHNSPPQPYESEDQEQVKEWIKAHQNVLDCAKEEFGTIIPARFDTIFKEMEGKSSRQVVKSWLNSEYDDLLEQLSRVEGKQEYGIQIFYDKKRLAEIISLESEEIAEFRKRMDSMPEGQAYIYKEKQREAINQKLKEREDELAQEFHQKIKPCVEELKIKEPKKAGKGKKMLLNLSCLVSEDKVTNLGDKLEEIDKQEGLSIRFTGPWAPYSFVLTTNE